MRVNRRTGAPRKPRDSDATVTAFFKVTETLLATKPFQDITVAEIITRTPHSRSSFYHHFDGKVDVLVALAASVLGNAYRGHALWDAQPGRPRARAMHASIEPTIAMWTDHGDVVGAVVEQMHTTPAVAQVWKRTFDRFVTAVSAQITQQWLREEISCGASPAMMATILVCGIERTFYVSSRGLDSRLPTPDSAVESIEWITLTAVHGRKPQTAAPAPAHPFQPAVSVDDASTVLAEQPDSTAGSILDALRSLLLEDPLDKVSVARITERAQVSRSTFYFYFDNKNAAFAALYRGLAEATAASLRRLHTIDRTNAALVESTLAEWLRIDDHAVAIMRSALHEWPRRAELRTVYREGMSAMADILESILIQDRTTGVALAGPPPNQFAAVLLWTVERSIAGALAGEDHLDNLDQVIPCLSALLTSAIYGR
jgi:TetR/AcrR family transcriptional regulator, ethionamide resistance regulator